MLFDKRKIILNNTAEKIEWKYNSRINQIMEIYSDQHPMILFIL